jgi:hypothetical protein
MKTRIYFDILNFEVDSIDEKDEYFLKYIQISKLKYKNQNYYKNNHF